MLNDMTHKTLFYILYDNQCSLCSWSKGWLLQRDTKYRLQFIGIHTPELREQFPWLELTVVRGAIHVVWPKGAEFAQAKNSEDYHIEKGIRAFRVIVQQLPAWRWLGWLLYFPGALWVGDKVYVWIARNRYNFPASWFIAGSNKS